MKNFKCISNAALIIFICIKGNLVLAVESESFTLVSPQFCRIHERGIMKDCQLPVYVSGNLATNSTVLPLETSLTIEKSPDCGVQKSLTALIEFFVDGEFDIVDGRSSRRFVRETLVLRDKTLVSIRKKEPQDYLSVLDFGKLSMKSVEIHSPSRAQWTELRFPQGCKILANISLNVPKVKNRDEARGIIGQYRQELETIDLKILLIENVAEHQKLLDLLEGLANNFNMHLALETISRLGFRDIPTSVIEDLKKLKPRPASVHKLIQMIGEIKASTDECFADSNPEGCIQKKYKNKSVKDLLTGSDLDFYMGIKGKKYSLIKDIEDIESLKDRKTRIEQNYKRAKRELSPILSMSERGRLAMAKEELKKSLESYLVDFYEEVSINFRKFKD